MRLTVALACFLGLASLARSDSGPYVGYEEDGYRYAGSGYWTNGSGDFYTRTRVDYVGYKSYYSYGRYYQQPQPYYYYVFTRATKPVASLTPASSDAEFVDFLKQREKIQGAIALDKQRSDSFIAKMQTIGITPPFPQLPGSYYLTPQQGATVYGYSYSQVADFYNQTDINVALQQSAALVKGAQALAGDGNTQFSQLIGQINTGAARVAEIRAEGEVAVAKINATRPPSRIVTEVKGTGIEPQTLPKIPPDEPERAPRVSVASTSCVSCHSGPKAAGKFDMTKAPTEEQQRKMAYRMSLPAADPKHMPQAADGSPGKQLSMKEILNVLGEAARASVPKP